MAADAKAAQLTAYRSAKDAAGSKQAVRRARTIRGRGTGTVQLEAAEGQAELDATVKAEIAAHDLAEKSRIAWLLEDGQPARRDATGDILRASLASRDMFTTKLTNRSTRVTLLLLVRNMKFRTPFA